MINVFDELDYTLNKHLSPIHFSTFNIEGVFRGWTADSVVELNEWYNSEDFDGPSNDDEVVELYVYGEKLDAETFNDAMYAINNFKYNPEFCRKTLAETYNESEIDALRFLIIHNWCFETEYPYQLEYDARIVAAMNLKHIEGYSDDQAITDAFGNHSIDLADAEVIRYSKESDYHDRFEKLLNTLGIELDKEGNAVYEPEEKEEIDI